MTADVMYKIMLYAISKNENGALSPDEFNRIAPLAQNSYISFLLGSFQQYQPGRPQPRIGLGQNMTVRQRLTPVIYGYVLNVNSTGRCPYPGDYLQTDAMTSIYGYKRIRGVQQDSLFSYMNSSIDPITENPIYLLKDDGFQFYPEDITQANLSYVRNPPPIKWAFTLDGNGRPVYDPLNSVDPIFDDLSMLEIIVRALALVGVNLQLSQVSQYAEQIKQQGQ